jgi:hypothetical protein
MCHFDLEEVNNRMICVTQCLLSYGTIAAAMWVGPQCLVPPGDTSLAELATFSA